MMKAEELRSKSVDDLQKLIDNLSEKQLHLRFQISSSEHTHTHSIKVMRRDIARVKTILREKQTND